MKRLNDRFYTLECTAKVWNDLLFKILCDISLKQMAAVPFVFLKKNMNIIYYADVLIILFKNEDEIDSVQLKLNERFKSKHKKDHIVYTHGARLF